MLTRAPARTLPAAGQWSFLAMRSRSILNRTYCVGVKTYDGGDLVLTGPPTVKRNLPRDGAKAGQLKGECNVPGETFSGLTDDLDAIAEGKERDDRTIHRHRRLRRAPRSPIRVLPLAARADSVTHTRRRPPRGGATADGETGCIDCAVCVVECAEPL